MGVNNPAAVVATVNRWTSHLSSAEVCNSASSTSRFTAGARREAALVNYYWIIVRIERRERNLKAPPDSKVLDFEWNCGHFVDTALHILHHYASLPILPQEVQQFRSGPPNQVAFSQLPTMQRPRRPTEHWQVVIPSGLHSDPLSGLLRPILESSMIFYDFNHLLLISSATLFRPFQHLNFGTLWDTLRSQEQFTCVAACLTCHCQICSIWKKRCPWNISAVASPAGWASLAYICVCNSLRLELIFLMAFVFQLMALHLMLGEVLASLVSKDYKESRDMNVLPRGCVASTMIH